MKTFKAGSFRLAIDAGVPIVPIAIHGTADIMEKNRNIMCPAVVHLTILQPLTYASFKDQNTKDLAEIVSNLILPHAKGEK